MAQQPVGERPPGAFFRVHAGGFPSPGEDWIEKDLDIASLIVPHPASTYFAHVEGCSMQGAGIFDSDILVIDKALDPKPGSIIIAVLDGQYIVRRLEIQNDCLVLQAAHPAYPPLSVTLEMNCWVWGVVTFVLRPIAPTGPLAAQLLQHP